MPGRVVKINGGRYRVIWGGKVTARATTRARAERQLRLLRAKEHGWKPAGKPARSRYAVGRHGTYIARFARR